MPLIKINGIETEVPAGVNLIEAAKQIGIEIPHYCYHPGLRVVASCRMCLVKIEGMPKLVPACQTPVREAPPERKVDGKYDMVVVTNDEVVKDAQESILEFLLLNHPVDCPECDQAGECLLQDYTYKYGKDHSRFEFEKRVPPRKDLGPEILLIATRCILCSRCVRFTQEVTGTREIFIKNRGYQAEIEVYPGKSLNNKLSMCTADICPVGALVTKDFLFKPRNWRYQKVRTVCPGCSVGCNVQIEYMDEDNQIYRIKPVYNAEVNQWWACDDGRLLYHVYRKLERFEYPLIRENGSLVRSNWKKALLTVRDTFRKYRPEQIAVVGSGYLTNEENYLLQKIFRQGLESPHVCLNDRLYREEDVVYPKFVIKGEKVPNYQGAQDTLQPSLSFDDLLKKIEKGEIKALYWTGGGPYQTLSEADLAVLDKLEWFVVQDIAHNVLTEKAHLVLAGATAYEKEGTFTNYQNRVQRIRPGVMPPLAAKTDFEILQELADLLDVGVYIRPEQVFLEISEKVDGYQGMSYAALGELGLPKGQKVPAEMAK
ncbi:MAG: molybdopterin-dependent oxidoreductase [Calditrichaeota bacterium]|nr:molybdopterin-dependent oxidoreductase [Calditrichota bacterium]